MRVNVSRSAWWDGCVAVRGKPVKISAKARKFADPRMRIEIERVPITALVAVA